MVTELLSAAFFPGPDPRAPGTPHAKVCAKVSTCNGTCKGAHGVYILLVHSMRIGGHQKLPLADTGVPQEIRTQMPAQSTQVPYL
eukprot:scaffold42060_cov29-Tisochrysis_lutea.AAC.2